MKLYIAGPMSGLPENNYPAFFAAEEELKAAGHEVLNPARNPKCDSWAGYMRAGITQLMQADGVALLPGWGESEGAIIECTLAIKLGLDVFMSEDWASGEIK